MSISAGGAVAAAGVAFAFALGRGLSSRGIAGASSFAADLDLALRFGAGRSTSISAGGVGAAGLITFGIFGGMTLSTYGDLDDTCPDGNCPVGSQEDIDAGQTYQTVANVGLVIGLVGAAASATLFLLPMLTGSDEGASEEEMAAARRHPPLTIGVGPGALTIGGHF